MNKGTENIAYFWIGAEHGKAIILLVLFLTVFVTLFGMLLMLTIR